jgi:hypothetical protein
VKIVKAIQQAAAELQQLECGVGSPGSLEHEGSYR